MLKAYYKFFFLLISLTILIASCSRKKDSFISRNLHAVSTEFNILYNGYLDLEAGKELLNSNYKDNYYEILPVERLEITDDIVLSGESENANFAKAEEKAVKAVQKHSMSINGREKNPQIDEAYLLLGKARYYDQRFVPALAAFNAILSKYPGSDKINYAKIWREKTHIRLENNELAIKNLKRLLEEEELEKQDLANATSMLAQAYINLQYLDSAVAQINIAANETKNNDERGRYRIIQAQLYNRIGYADSANIAFDKVIELNRKTPRIYLIAAHVGKAKNFDYQSGNKEAFLESLTALEEDRENRPYLDKIYHQIAEYHLNNKSDYLAIDYYNKSLRTQSDNKLLQARNYLALGNINFNLSSYQEAGAYYDSTMTNLKLNSKTYRSIKRKRDNLTDVILYENTARVNDSILYLASLSIKEKLDFFQEYVENLKHFDEEEKQKKDAINYGTVNVIDNFNAGNNIDFNTQNKASGPNSNSTFYFYNQQTIAFGKNEFTKIWGNRKLEDNWRLSNKNALFNEEVIETEAISELATEEERYDPKFYVSQIPTDKKIIDSITKDRNLAYYKLGVIYKEKFKEYSLAKDKLQTLLSYLPDEKLVLPTKYQLYKIYELLNNTSEAQITKNDIISSYPESRYATILKNPELAVDDSENNPESIYDNLYKAFENQNYTQVINKCLECILRFDNEPIVPKFELLKATAIGRLKGYKAYAEALDFVALTYANTDEGKQAQKLILETLPSLSNETFVDDSEGLNFKAIYSFNKKEKEEINNFNEALGKAIKKVKYYDLTISKDVYNKDTIFIVVHGFNTIEGAKGFARNLDEIKSEIKDKAYFAVSSGNYKIIQVHKNLEAYMASH